MFWQDIKPTDTNENQNRTEGAAVFHKTEGGDLDEAMRTQDDSNYPKGIIFRSIKDPALKLNKSQTVKNPSNINTYGQRTFSIDESRLFLERLNEVETMCNEELKNVEHMKEVIKPLHAILNDSTKYQGLQAFALPSSISLKNNALNNNAFDNNDDFKDDNEEEEDDENYDILDENDDYVALSGTTIPYVSPLVANKDK